MSEPFVARIRAEMGRHATGFAGQYVDSPRAHALFGAAMTTVHPLGGCPMGETGASGVVDADCRVFDPSAGVAHRGLYVMDGSIVPASLGANPLLTIAALAERAAARFT
jgi:cholesterol oxidase